MLTSLLIAAFIAMAQLQLATCQRKNVLFVMADDLRPEIGVYTDGDDTFYKGIRTPNFDAFAADSLVMNRAYVQIALCAPSRNSILTGRRPDTTRSYDLDNCWRDTGGNFSTIPQYFREQGYYTINVGKVFHPGTSGCNNDKDFSWTETPYTAGGESIWEGTKEYSWQLVEPEIDIQYPQKDRFLTDYAKEKLRERAPDALAGVQPFFLALGFARPHLPLIAAREYFELYPEQNVSIASNRYVPENLPSIAWSNWGELQEYEDIAALDGVDGTFNTSLPDYYAIDLRRAYYATVSFIDALFGEMLAELDSLGLANDTVVVLLSDNGYQLGEHSEWCKHTNFEVAAQVPVMLRMPGITDGGRGRRTDAFVELVDVFPTLVEATGVESIPLCPLDSSKVKVCHEGHSLVELAREEQQWKSAAFFQYPRYSGTKMGYVIRTTEYQYVKWVEFRGIPLWNDRNNHELYDLTMDPNMNENVVGDDRYSEIVSELDAKLQEGWRNALPPTALNDRL